MDQALEGERGVLQVGLGLPHGLRPTDVDACAAGAARAAGVAFAVGAACAAVTLPNRAAEASTGKTSSKIFFID